MSSKSIVFCHQIVKIVKTYDFELGKLRVCRLAKMFVVGYNVIGLASECAINKFVVIVIVSNYSKAELRVFVDNICGLVYHFQKHISHNGRSQRS